MSSHIATIKAAYIAAKQTTYNTTIVTAIATAYDSANKPTFEATINAA